MNFTFPKRLPAEFHNRKIRVSTRAYRRYLTHSLEKIHWDIFGVIRQWVTPGSVVWDIGANCGVFTFAAALQTGSTGKVLSVEADVQCAALIERSLRYCLKDEASITICPFAVSDQDGAVYFEVSGYRSAASSLKGFGRFQSPGNLRSVASFKLDTLCKSFDTPDLLKVDVEGAEHIVLRGAVELLEKHRPVLVCECGGGDVGSEINAILRKANYGWRPMVAAPSELFTQNAISASDIVAIPCEHPAFVA